MRRFSSTRSAATSGVIIRLALSVSLGVTLFLLGCAGHGTRVGKEGAAGNHRNFTDGIGRAVSIKPDPQRIVSLAPNLTEILFALGLGDRIAGVTSYCDFPEAAKAKEKIGDTIHPNLEKIISLKPDLVIVSTSSQLENLTRQLDQLAIPVYVTNPRTVSETVASIRSLGEITGAAASAAKLAAEMEARIAAVRQRVKDRPAPRVFYVLQTSPLITAGRNTFINDLINLAGGKSISGEETADYPQFSRETVVARAPEVIIAPASHGSEWVKESDLRRDFAVTPAIRSNRIVKVNPDLVDRPGPRIVEGLERLAEGIHPSRSLSVPPAGI
jgi:iron complex transport system substrate-binding protein